MNIAIIFGGKSFEHDVSIVTAKQIYNVAKIKHNVHLVYIDKNDNFLLYENKNFDYKDFKGVYKFRAVYFSDGKMITRKLFGYKSAKIDCAIVCCHGGNGESGVLQSVLSMAKIPVSSGSVFALSCAMDKWQTKNMLKALNISVVDGMLADAETNINDIIKRVEKHLQYPVIVKPNSGGSSIGIEVAKTREELVSALEIGFRFDNKCVVEHAIEDFEEYNQAVLGYKSDVEISYIESPKRAKDILSFEDKYLAGSKTKKGMKGLKKQELILNKNMQKKIGEISKKIFTELGFFGVIRIDYMLDKTHNKLYVNEINAVPGSLAIYFYSQKHTALWFIDKLIEIAIKNYADNDKIDKNYITKLF